MQFDYVRYLRAKISVDDRALNQSVLGALKEIVRPSNEKSVLRVVDIGAGIGAMVHRLLDRKDMFEGYTSIEYTIVDVKEEVLRNAQELLRQRVCTTPESANSSEELGRVQQFRAPFLGPNQSVHHTGFEVTSGKNVFHIEDVVVTGSPSCTVRFKQADARCFLLSNSGKFDLVIAAAFLDLFSLDVILPIVRQSLDEKSPIRAFYFPVTFDGITHFASVLEDEAESWQSIIDFFHFSMGSGFVGGQKMSRSHSGRHLGAAVSNAGGRISAAGPSIWNVRKDMISGTYPGDEAYFMECILLFIQSALTDEFYSKISRSTVEKLFNSVRTQLRNSTLTYEAHNIDVCGVF